MRFGGSLLSFRRKERSKEKPKREKETDSVSRKPSPNRGLGFGFPLLSFREKKEAKKSRNGKKKKDDLQHKRCPYTVGTVCGLWKSPFRISEQTPAANCAHAPRAQFVCNIPLFALLTLCFLLCFFLLSLERRKKRKEKPSHKKRPARLSGSFDFERRNCVF